MNGGGILLPMTPRVADSRDHTHLYVAKQKQITTTHTHKLLLVLQFLPFYTGVLHIKKKIISVFQNNILSAFQKQQHQNRNLSKLATYVPNF